MCPYGGSNAGRPAMPDVWTIPERPLQCADVEVCRCQCLMRLSNEEVRAAWGRLVDEVRDRGLTDPARRPSVRLSCALCVRKRLVPRVSPSEPTRASHTTCVGGFTGESIYCRAGQAGKNPLALQRINLQGDAVMLSPTDAAYEARKQRYLLKFPQSELMFGFGDFALWELRMTDVHLVLGFGQAYQACSTNPQQWLHQKPGKTT